MGAAARNCALAACCAAHLEARLASDAGVTIKSKSKAMMTVIPINAPNRCILTMVAAMYTKKPAHKMILVTTSARPEWAMEWRMAASVSPSCL